MRRGGFWAPPSEIPLKVSKQMPAAKVHPSSDRCSSYFTNSGGGTSIRGKPNLARFGQTWSNTANTWAMFATDTRQKVTRGVLHCNTTCILIGGCQDRLVWIFDGHPPGRSPPRNSTPIRRGAPRLLPQTSVAPNASFKARRAQLTPPVADTLGMSWGWGGGQFDRCDRSCWVIPGWRTVRLPSVRRKGFSCHICGTCSQAPHYKSTPRHGL